MLLESNDIPGLSGFPEETQEALARIVRVKIEHYKN
jgi:ribosomal protein S6--L-glutamate ligase